jgi:hypothetical protein
MNPLDVKNHLAQLVREWKERGLQLQGALNLLDGGIRYLAAESSSPEHVAELIYTDLTSLGEHLGLAESLKSEEVKAYDLKTLLSQYRQIDPD